MNNVTTRYRKLDDTERSFICEFVRTHVPIARNASHTMRLRARREIAIAMWCWTADGVDIARNVVKQNAFKYDTTIHPATRNAIAARRSGTVNLRHEHAVPRMFLADRIIDLDLDVRGIQALLIRFCRAVIVTRDEDRQIRPRKRMPDGWDWELGDPYDRYRVSNLRDQLVNVVQQ